MYTTHNTLAFPERQRKAFLWILFVACGLLATPSQASVDIPQPDLSQATPGIKQGYSQWATRVENAERGDYSRAQKAESWGMLGMYLLAHDYNTEASQAFARAIKYLPLDARWHYLSGYVDHLNGDQGAAQEKWQKTLELNPYYFPAMVRLGQLQLQAGQLDQARDWFEKARHSQESEAAALVGLGQVSLQRDEADKALEYFQRALRLQPHASKLHFYLAQAYGAVGDIEQAEKHLQQQGARRDVVLPDRLLAQVGAMSRSAVKLNERATAELRAKRYKQAEEYARQAISSDPGNIHPHLTLAYIYAESGRHQQAKTAMDTVLKKSPDDAALLYAAAVLREIAGDEKTAENLYRRALAIDPANGKAMVGLSKSLMRQGRYQEALEWTRKTRSVQPENPFVPYRQAYLELYLKQCDAAKKSFLEAVGMQPENFAFLTGYVRAIVLCDSNDEEIANALNAARNMYRVKPLLPVIEVLAAVESVYGDRQAGLDYQAQALFEAAKGSVPSWWLKRLKSNYEKMQAGQYPVLWPHPVEEDLSPPALKSIF